VNVLSGLDEEGNSILGLITIVIVPDLPGPKPTPTAEILQIVETHLKEITPNIGKLKVTGPVYYQVNIRAQLVTTNLEAVSEIETQVKRKIEGFLHPLTGGTKGKGWDFGQIPSKSDFYSLFSDFSGISYIKTLDVTFKTEDRLSEKGFRHSRSRPLPESTLPCSGKHEINLIWRAEREE
jgi:hypothetical protein